jgi:hypothetical protein
MKKAIRVNYANGFFNDVALRANDVLRNDVGYAQ